MPHTDPETLEMEIAAALSPHRALVLSPSRAQKLAKGEGWLGHPPWGLWRSL